MNSKIIKINLLVLCFLITGIAVAQNTLTKVSQSINVDKEVSIDLNTSHCNIVFDTWNRDVVEVEAYIEGEKLSDDELKKALKSWKVDVDATKSQVSINAKGSGSRNWVVHSAGDDDVKIILKELKYALADMPDMDFDIDVNVELPEVPEVPELPELPALPELPEDIHRFNFDYEAYEKDGEKYLKKYTEQFESKFGKDFEKQMEAWGEKFGKEWGEKYAKQMEAWAKQFEKQWDNEAFAEKMAAWGERYAEQMERHAERMEAQAERHAEHAERLAEAHRARVETHKERAEAHKERAKERAKLVEQRQQKVIEIIDGKPDMGVKKTIKIKMPKKAKLKVNVRHGEIEFAANVDNLDANVSHTTFKAQSIGGSLTSINASYSPVYVANWNLGELNLNYVNEADLENVNHLVLNAISSNVEVGELSGSAVIDGNIGDLSIEAIAESFINLNIMLQNSNAVITLPKTDCNVQFKGTHSHFSHPQKKTKEPVSNFSSGRLASGKSIVVNAKYSNVLMK